MSDKCFKMRVDFEERKKESESKRAQYPYLIPIIIEKQKNSTLTILEKTKFLFHY